MGDRQLIMLLSSLRPASRACRSLYPAANRVVSSSQSLNRMMMAAAAGLSKTEVTERVLNAVKNFEKVDPAKVSDNAHFKNDLGLDSLDSVELVMVFEDEFVIEIPDNEAEKITSCAEAIDYIASHPHAK